MMISHDDLESYDHDWFAIDGYGHIGHFATAGFGWVPKHMEIEHLTALKPYFRNLPIIGEFQESRKWKDYAGIPGKDYLDEKRFLSDYSKLAARGLYSFDFHSALPSPDVVSYFRVTCPAVALNFHDISQEVQSMIGKYLFPQISFCDSDELLRWHLGDCIS